MYHHIPVLLREVVDYLQPRPGQNFIDCTLGGGGHAIEIAKRVSPSGKVLGIDLDPASIEFVELKRVNNLILVNDNYKNLKKIKNKRFNYPISGILLDLGLSSAQLEISGRGFSFQKNEELDMKFSGIQPSASNVPYSSLTAKEIVNNWSEKELVQIFKQYGEEPNAKKIAQALVKQRKIKPINTTFELCQIINHIVGLQHLFKRSTGSSSEFLNKSPFWSGETPCQKGAGLAKTKKPASQKGMGNPLICRPEWRKKRNPATRVFQALRIAVNQEFENLKQTLPLALEVLEPRGRLAVISFHRLEDRIVKDFFRQESRDCLCPSEFPVCRCGHKARLKIVTKKPVTPLINEIKSNPRSRSAKLRVIEKLNDK